MQPAEPVPEVFAGWRQRWADQRRVEIVGLALLTLAFPRFKMRPLGEPVIGPPVELAFKFGELDQLVAEPLIKDASSPRNSTSWVNNQPNSSSLSSLKTASGL